MGARNTQRVGVIVITKVMEDKYLRQFAELISDCVVIISMGHDNKSAMALLDGYKKDYCSLREEIASIDPNHRLLDRFTGDFDQFYQDAVQPCVERVMKRAESDV